MPLLIFLLVNFGFFLLFLVLFLIFCFIPGVTTSLTLPFLILFLPFSLLSLFFLVLFVVSAVMGMTRRGGV